MFTKQCNVENVYEKYFTKFGKQARSLSRIQYKINIFPKFKLEYAFPSKTNQPTPT